METDPLWLDKSGAERLPPLTIGYSVLDIECSKRTLHKVLTTLIPAGPGKGKAQ